MLDGYSWGERKGIAALSGSTTAGWPDGSFLHHALAPDYGFKKGTVTGTSAAPGSESISPSNVGD